MPKVRNNEALTASNSTAVRMLFQYSLFHF